MSAGSSRLPLPTATPSAASSEYGSSEDQRWPGHQSPPYYADSHYSSSSPKLEAFDEDDEYDEKFDQAAFLRWQRLHGRQTSNRGSPVPQQQQTTESLQPSAHGQQQRPLLQRAYSKRQHEKKLSEQLLEWSEKVTAPVKRGLAAASPPYYHRDGGVEEASSSQGSAASSSSRDASPNGSLTSRLPVELSSRQIRRLLKALYIVVGLLFVSAMLPHSSRLSLFRYLGGNKMRDGPPIPDYDVKNQGLASGKGWGWKVDSEQADSLATIAKTPAEKAKADHAFAYAGLQEAEQSKNATKVYPNIACQLDTVAFAQHYKLTPNFKYARRYVTAKSVAPELDGPAGFDPYPRQVQGQAIVEGWDSMHWRGFTPEDICNPIQDPKQRAICMVKERRKEALRHGKKVSSSSDRKGLKKRIGQSTDDAVNTLDDDMSPLSSCSSSSHPLELPTYPVPRTRTQPHNLILGLASDVTRMSDLLPELAYSFAYSNLHLVLNLPPDRRIETFRKALRDRGIRATIIQSTEDDYLRRWAELPSLLSDFADAGLTKWAIVADDDTFFLSLPKVLKMLDRYDDSKPHYIGGLTDDWKQAPAGMIGFGGGGVILSMPLLEELQPHWSSCAQGRDAADKRLAQCIYEHTHTRLSIEWGLMQVDLNDDIRGLLESGRQMMTMHHWKNWNFGFDPVLVARAGGVCGSECLLQRFLLNGPGEGGINSSDSSSSSSLQKNDAAEQFLFVHGLSLTLYPTPLPDFTKTELTWKVWRDSQFSHAIGPTRSRIREGRPPLSSSSSSGGGLFGLGKKSGSSSKHSHWKETWLLEDVRLDESNGGLASNFDGDGRGMREIYIKRASRTKGYITAPMFSEADKAKEDSTQSSDAIEDIKKLLSSDETLADEEWQKHKDLEGSIKGLVANLLGLSSSSSAEGDRAERIALAEKMIKEELEAEEEDSVIELIWV